MDGAHEHVAVSFRFLAALRTTLRGLLLERFLIHTFIDGVLIHGSLLWRTGHAMRA